VASFQIALPLERVECQARNNAPPIPRLVDRGHRQQSRREANRGGFALSPYVPSRANGIVRVSNSQPTVLRNRRPRPPAQVASHRSPAAANMAKLPELLRKE
jgi:hypothetical protein